MLTQPTITIADLRERMEERKHEREEKAAASAIVETAPDPQPEEAPELVVDDPEPIKKLVVGIPTGLKWILGIGVLIVAAWFTRARYQRMQETAEKTNEDEHKKEPPPSLAAQYQIYD